MEFVKGTGGLVYLAAVLASAFVIELLAPWRKGVKIDMARWLRNASMAAYGTILLSLIPFIAAYGAAVSAETNGIGALNQFGAPLWAKLIISVAVLDLMAYGQHRALHKWYIFWRAHRAHHTDEHIDLTTSLRFHPFETLFRAIIELGVVLTIGIPPEGILLSYMVQVFANTISHTNATLPLAVDKIVSRVFTTPQIHRLHHSTNVDHQFTNFGTVFTLWDQLFGTYLSPEHLHDDERFGVDGPEGDQPDTFATLALDPFRKPKQAAIPQPATTHSSV
ncbi:sterol desaturase family protein [Hyphococcus sp.]|uniref:sterol desaturase family protein n=1 Tax=Hyphococcus sp. TaxID=2038636 RepID=UPI0020814859|nr:MAG: sterol desaturase [Marinicaulis sp.]